MKRNKQIANIIAGAFLILSIYLYFIVFKSTNGLIFFLIIITTALIEGILLRILTTKHKKTDKTASIKKKRDRNRNGAMNKQRLNSDDVIMKTPLKELSWREFERLCYLYFKAHGYKPRETSEGADGGVDLIIFNRYHNTNEAVQMKHYINSSNPITVKEIRELSSAKRNHNCLLAKFITTTTFTQNASREADKFKITCHDINWVESKIEKWRKQKQTKTTSVVK